ncbi:tRNA-guanine(15) transglycosylase-like protein [Geopyxis carbonaria]|nr:tRNA-guanine(15) transglycosylase-like protein [Geopyxis carbonaria]
MASESQPDNMLSFSLLVKPTTTTARVGRLLGRGITLETPGFISPSSRGVVPHLSHDNLRDHTNIQGVYVALEDFVEKGLHSSPAIQHSGPLRAFTSQPDNSFLFLGARRSPPVQTAAANTDHSVAILTSVGFCDLKINDYISAVSALRPDAAISVPDIPTKPPGKNRRPKMVFRIEKWLDALLQGSGEVPIIAVMPPLEMSEQSLYIDMLVERKDKLVGLALYDSVHAHELPAELNDLLRLAMDDPGNPHKLLKSITGGIDLFNLSFPNAATDSGIALDFVFPGEKLSESRLRPMGRDLWDTVFATDLAPLVEGCKCYTCRKHHKAYIHHLLSAKEMTAWVLLQIHNTWVIDEFFKSIRESIDQEAFEEGSKTFLEVYEPELPQRTGEGPRIKKLLRNLAELIS